MLRIEGKEKFANEKQSQYEYFMNNREKIPELMQKGYKTNELNEVREFIGDPVDIDFSEIEQRKIEYKGISISEDGLIYGFNEYGEITREVVSEHFISEIEVAVERGEILLNEQQRNTLLKAKQNIELNKKIGQEDFKIVAEASFEEKSQALNDLKMATKEKEEKSKTYDK